MNDIDKAFIKMMFEKNYSKVPLPKNSKTGEKYIFCPECGEYFPKSLHGYETYGKHYVKEHKSLT